MCSKLCKTLCKCCSCCYCYPCFCCLFCCYGDIDKIPCNDAGDIDKMIDSFFSANGAPKQQPAPQREYIVTAKTEAVPNEAVLEFDTKRQKAMIEFRETMDKRLISLMK